MVGDADELTASAFGAAVEQWLLNPVVGGKGAIGHGLVEPVYDRPFPDPGPFLRHMRERREGALRSPAYRARDWRDVWVPKPPATPTGRATSPARRIPRRTCV